MAEDGHFSTIINQSGYQDERNNGVDLRQFRGSISRGEVNNQQPDERFLKAYHTWELAASGTSSEQTSMCLREGRKLLPGTRYHRHRSNESCSTARPSLVTNPSKATSATATPAEGKNQTEPPCSSVPSIAHTARGGKCKSPCTLHPRIDKAGREARDTMASSVCPPHKPRIWPVQQRSVRDGASN